MSNSIRLIVTYSIKYRNYLSGLRESQVARAKAKIEKGASSVEKKSQNSPSRFIKQTSCTNDGEEAAYCHEYRESDRASRSALQLLEAHI